MQYTDNASVLQKITGNKFVVPYKPKQKLIKKENRRANVYRYID